MNSFICKAGPGVHFCFCCRLCCFHERGVYLWNRRGIGFLSTPLAAHPSSAMMPTRQRMAMRVQQELEQVEEKEGHHRAEEERGPTTATTASAFTPCAGYFAPPPLSPYGDGLHTIPSIRALETIARSLYTDKHQISTSRRPSSSHDDCPDHHGRKDMEKSAREGERRERGPTSPRGPEGETEAGRKGGESEGGDADRENRSHVGGRRGSTEAEEEEEMQMLMERLIVACHRSKEQLVLARAAAQHYKRMEKRGDRALEGQAKALRRERARIEGEWEREREEREGRRDHHHDSSSSSSSKEEEEGRASYWWKKKEAEAVRRVLTGSDAGGRGRLASQPAVMVPFP